MEKFYGILFLGMEKFKNIGLNQRNIINLLNKKEKDQKRDTKKIQNQIFNLAKNGIVEIKKSN